MDLFLLIAGIIVAFAIIIGISYVKHRQTQLLLLPVQENKGC